MTTSITPSAADAGPRRVDRGDIFWIAPDAVEDPDARGGAAGFEPFESQPSGPEDASDAHPGPAHPHLVVQDDVFNHSRISTVVVCALTSNLRRASEPGNVLLDEGEGGLPRQSVVVVSQISSVPKARLGARVGSLAPERVEQVLAGLRFQQAAFFR